MNQINKKIGKSIYFLNIMTELLKSRSETETFEDVVSLKVRKIGNN